MAGEINRRIVLANRPRGEATVDNFRYEEVSVPEIGPGQVLVRNEYLSLDPYQRRRMDELQNYAPPHPVGKAMIGQTVGEVVASSCPTVAVGQTVLTTGGWQDYSVVAGDALRVLPETGLPISVHLGLLGLTGLTAHYGLATICDPKPGQTVLVSAASGAVGGAVGLLARHRGARAVGFAGGPEKCAYAERELGYSACIDYKLHQDEAALSDAVAEACPDGVDCIFENVGGRILDAGMRHVNPFGRIALCGMIAGYEEEPIPMRDPGILLWQRIRLQGFIIGEHSDAWPAALEELTACALSLDRLPRETVAQGLASAPEAFLGMLRGCNLGKQLVRL